MKNLLFTLMILISGCSTVDKVRDILKPGTEPEPGYTFPLGVVDFTGTCKDGIFRTKICYSVVLPENTVWIMVDPNHGNHQIPIARIDSEKGTCFGLEFIDGGTGDLIKKKDGKMVHAGGPAFKNAKSKKWLEIFD